MAKEQQDQTVLSAGLAKTESWTRCCCCCCGVDYANGSTGGKHAKYSNSLTRFTSSRFIDELELKWKADMMKQRIVKTR